MVRLLGIGDNTVDVYLAEGMQYPGGNALNVAVYARRAGAQASYLGCIGGDSRGTLIEQSLIAEGLDVSHVRRLEGPNSFSRICHNGPDRVFAGGDPGVRACYNLTPKDESFIASHDVVHTSVYSGLDSSLPRLRRTARLLSYDYSENWGLPGTDITMCEVDIAFLSGPHRSLSDCEALARHCASQGPAVVVVTRGAEGVLVLVSGEVILARAEPTTVVDTLGAGDAFIAGFLVSYAQGEPVQNSLRRGTSLAALACTVKGAFGHGVPLPATQLPPGHLSDREQLISEEKRPMKRRSFTTGLLAAAGSTALAGPLLPATARAQGKVILHFLHKWPEPHNIKFFQDVVRGFEAAHPNVSIDMTAVADQPYKQHIRVLMASGDIPDIYFTWVGEYTREFIAAGRVLDITSYISRPEWQGRFAASTLDAYKTDGKQYGIPLEVDAKFFVYNKALLAKVGVRVPPADWPAFTAMLDRIKGSGTTPIAFGSQIPWATVHYIGDLNAKLVPYDTRLADYLLRTPAAQLFTDAGYVQALSYYREFLTKGWFNRFPNAFTHSAARASFYAGRTAMMYLELVEFASVAGTTVANDGWDFFPMPAIPNGRGRQDLLTGAPDGFVVSSTCKHPDVAMAFLNYLTTSKNGAEFTEITGRPSAVLGAVTAANASPQTLRGMEAIKDAKGLVIWLDTAVQSQVAAAYLAGGQALMGEHGSPAEVMEKVRAAALVAQKQQR